MASIAFTFPAPVADFLNLYVPGFADASGGGATVTVQVPASAAALPAPVVAGLSEAGFQVSAAAAPAVPAAAPVAAPVAAPAADGGAVGVAQFAPAGLAPQGAALEDPNLEGAVSFAQGLGQAANGFFQQAVADGVPPSLEEIASFAAQQNQAVTEYFGGL